MSVRRKIVPPRFLLQPYGSVENLPAALTINNVTVLPTCRYKGGDASASGWPAWGYGENLSYVFVAAAPTYNIGSPLLSSADDGVWFKGNGGASPHGARFIGSASAMAVGTNDFVIEIVRCISVTTPNGDVYASHIVGAAAGWGWVCSPTPATPVDNLYIRDVNGLSGAIATATLIRDSWIHEICFVDRSGSAQWYVNGLASGSPGSVAAYQGTLTSTGVFSLGSYETGAYSCSSKLAYFALWSHAAWLDTHLQAAVAQERFAKLTGVYPRIARGTALPTIATRASSAYTDRIESDGSRRLYLVGINFLRTPKRADLTAIVDTGYLSEPTATSLCLQSENIATTWALGGSATRATNTAEAPNRATTADTLSAVANGDYLVQSFATITAVQHTYSHYLKRNGASDVAGKLQLVRTSTSAVIAETAFVATSAWERIEVTGTCVLDDTEIRLVINVAGKSLYVWGGQLELGPVASSYIPTTTVAVTRAAGVLRYKGDDGNLGATGSLKRGRVKARILLPSYDNVATPAIIDIAEAASNNDRLTSYIAAAGDRPQIAIIAGGVSGFDDGPAVDVCSGLWKTIECKWAVGAVRVACDGIAVTGTPADIPDALSTISVGVDRADASGLGGLINKLEIYDR